MGRLSSDKERSHRIGDVPAARALFAPIARQPREVLGFAYLDAEERLVGMRHAVGLRDWAQVPTRTVASDALAFEAAAVVMAHNHPSGNAQPSDDDLTATRRVAQALDALGVRLADHLVLTAGDCTSLRALGLL